MVVSSEERKNKLVYEFEKYSCKIPNIKVFPIDGEFTFAVLFESYGSNIALSWGGRGCSDVFWICNALGKQINEVKNTYQHYILIKDYERFCMVNDKIGVILKAFVDTTEGKITIAESDLIQLDTKKCENFKVSLIIPAYNSENCIARTIDNALAQSLSGLEIIVVDDGSTDFTSEIIDWYAETYSNVLAIHQKNGGVAAARNAGIEIASGEYLAFMDNDDMIHPDMMKRLYDSAKKNDCEIAITSIYMIENNGYKPFIQYTMKEDEGISIDEFFSLYYIPTRGLGCVVWNKLYLTSLVKKHRFPTIPYDEWRGHHIFYFMLKEFVISMVVFMSGIEQSVVVHS